MALVNGADSKMTTVKQYDPIKVVEGMFNGSMVCLANALKGNRDSIAQTKTVLAECSKKFQDSLDDCEIQILDAKWYLEQRLAEHRAKREAEAKAKASSPGNSITKRKVDEKEDQLRTGSPKRPRSNASSSPAPMEIVKEEAAAGDEQPAEQLQKETEDAMVRELKEEESESKQDITHEVDKQDSDDKTKNETGKAEEDGQDSAMKGSGQASPSMNDDYHMFESMFGDATDGNEAPGSNENNEEGDMNLDFEFEEQFNIPDEGDKATEADQDSDMNKNPQTQTQTQPQTQSQEMSRSQNASQNLTSLLPGDPNSFGDQAADPNGMDFAMDGTGNLTTAIDDDQLQNESNMFTDDFGPNIFDQAFEDGDFGNMDVGDIEDPGKNDLNFDDFFT